MELEQVRATLRDLEASNSRLQQDQQHKLNQISEYQSASALLSTELNETKKGNEVLNMKVLSLEQAMKDASTQSSALLAPYTEEINSLKSELLKVRSQRSSEADMFTSLRLELENKV